jgi:hypothetical protein
MSGNPSQPINVIPPPTNWPGPMFNPAGRSWPQPPSCFSELAALNACYDSVQMMEQILAKVITDLVQTNTAVQQAIVEAIAASGSNVPLIGVTNGSDAQPGQVGEFVSFSTQVPYTATPTSSVVSVGTLQPGDWDVWVFGIVTSWVSDVLFVQTPLPAGWTAALQATEAAVNSTLSVVLIANTVRALTSAPTLISYQVDVNNVGTGGTAGNLTLYTMARRRR